MGDKLLLNFGAKFQNLFTFSDVNYKIAMATSRDIVRNHVFASL